MIKVYGIPNCDTIKKTKDWLNKKSISFEFYDYKKEGISTEKLKAWSDKAGWELLLNKRGTTWKELPAAQQAKVTDAKTAIEVMRENPSMIKRPVIETKNGILVGFDEEQFKKQLK